MTSWPHADWRGFLADRLLLYEVCEVCATFPGAGTPSVYLGLHRRFSDAVCVEIDKGLAQYRRWYLARMEEQRKVGKSKWAPKYTTLGEVLGVGAEDRAGMTPGDFTDVTKAYKEAATAAIIRGEPMPDLETWLAERDVPMDDDDLD